jgi:hypothetical protein
MINLRAASGALRRGDLFATRQISQSLQYPLCQIDALVTDGGEVCALDVEGEEVNVALRLQITDKPAERPVSGLSAAGLAAQLV